MKIGRMTITADKFETDGWVRLDPLQAYNLLRVAKVDGPTNVEGLETDVDFDGWPTINADHPVSIPGPKAPIMRKAMLLVRQTEELAKLN